MRIISKFTDYYDSAMGLGHDASVTYVRHTQTCETPDGKLPPEYKFLNPGLRARRELTKKHGEVFLMPFTIAFCAKRFNGIRVFRPQNLAVGGGVIDKCCYSLEEFRDLLSELDITLKRLTKAQNWFSVGRVLYESEVQRFFDTTFTSKEEESLKASRRPLALCTVGVNQREPVLTFDENLKYWQFYRVVDAYQAFQELDMFLSGVAVNDVDAMARISDEDLARAKGFDCYSFKQEPKKRKRKTCITKRS